MVSRYIRDALQVLAAMTAGRDGAMATAARKAFVNMDGILLRIDPGCIATGADRRRAAAPDESETPTPAPSKEVGERS